MSHEIKRRDRQFGIETAWHGKTEVRPVLERDEVFPWHVEFVGLDRHDTGQPLSRWVIPVASDDWLPLGFSIPVNLDTYTPETPHESWDFSEEVLKGTEHQIVSAGTVQNRSKFFVSSKLTQLESILLDDGSTMELIFNSLGSLDKSSNKKVCMSTVRTVCYNTFMLNFLENQTVQGLREKLGQPDLMNWVKDGKTKLAWKFRHSKNMSVAVKEQFPIIEQAVGYSSIVKAMLNSLVSRPCDADRARRIYTGFLFGGRTEEKEVSTRGSNIIEEHVDCFRSGSGNSGENEYDLLNGLTQPLTRGYTSSKRDAWDTFETAEFGVYGSRKSEFARLLTIDRGELGIVEAVGKQLLSVAKN